ncbi:hypothetical protein TTHERM_00616020 (macronuclear) [Tetrahymena thermophila SB210]|uniref:Uncharacterized protein n=1 Tax=Tetrahymena thermophila (strain SB210) TaxID=312017 RepID=I7LXD6_TETTS|nr:hypothetical protein TTHERM_00616020 [Tetrahymena thermophila SB210]EAS04427.3 hypothetical protein TTHERM_00616020 [Tetrahymena thermophila SB210]|eukprot:XP_001024672.3 hypothetical protein TTHERM_00616020 [Tetrahymena thermophila SB210]
MFYLGQRRIFLLIETEKTISFNYMNPPDCPIRLDKSKCSQSDDMYESSKSLSGHIAYDDIGCICPVCWDVIRKGFSENKYIKSLYLEDVNKNFNVEYLMINNILNPQQNSSFLENLIISFDVIEADSLKSLKEYLQNAPNLKHLEIITGKINKSQFIEQGLAANKSIKFFKFELSQNCTNSDVKTLQSIINGIGQHQVVEKVQLLFENTIIGQIDFQNLFTKNKSIKQLRISFQRSRIDNNYAIQTIGKNLFKNQILQKFVLNLRAAEYKKECLSYFQQGIQKNTSISTFKVFIDGQGSKYLDQMMLGIAKNKSIKNLKLNISNLQLDSSNINSINSILQSNQHIESFNLLQSMYVFNNSESLLSNISIKSNLKEIKIQGYWLPQLTSLSKFIEHSEQIKKVSLQFKMNISGDLQQLAKSLQINKSIEYFAITNNENLSKEGFFEHWKGSQNLKHLEFINQQFFTEFGINKSDSCSSFEFILNSKNIKNLDIFPSDINKAILKLKEDGRQFDVINTRSYLSFGQIKQILEIQTQLVSLQYLSRLYSSSQNQPKPYKLQYEILKLIYENNYLIKFGDSSLIDKENPLQLHKELCLYRERQLLTILALINEVIPYIQYSPLFTLMDLHCE